jgi:hypothetical protein
MSWVAFLVVWTRTMSFAADVDYEVPELHHKQTVEPTRHGGPLTFDASVGVGFEYFPGEIPMPHVPVSIGVGAFVARNVAITARIGSYAGVGLQLWTSHDTFLRLGGGIPFAISPEAGPRLEKGWAADFKFGKMLTRAGASSFHLTGNVLVERIDAAVNGPTVGLSLGFEWQVR